MPEVALAVSLAASALNISIILQLSSDIPTTLGLMWLFCSGKNWCAQGVVGGCGVMLIVVYCGYSSIKICGESLEIAFFSVPHQSFRALQGREVHRR